jgi:iron complex transport system substrate-binding protein
MRKQRRRSLLKGLGMASTVGLTSVAGCAQQGGGTGTSSTTTTATEQTVTDMADREVTVPASVERTIGIGSGALRMLVYMGAADRVVGVETLETTNEKRPYRPYALAHPELRDLSGIGSRKSPDSELILKQEPDVVFWAWASKKKADDLQSKLGIPVVVVTPGDLNPDLRPQFFGTLELMGTVLDASDRAESLQTYTEDTISDLDSRTPSGESPTVYIGYLGRAKHGLKYTQPLYPPFDMTGANNVASDVTEDLKKKKGAARTTIDPEKVIEWDPEYLFIDLGLETYEDLEKEEYQSITAIENDDVYGLPPTRDYSINFGTVLANAYYVGSVLFPDAYSDVTPESKADAIYEEFVGAEVYDDVADAYGGFGKLDRFQ